MKKLCVLLLIMLTLTSCNPESFLFEDDTHFIEESDDIQYYNENINGDPLKNYPQLDENFRTQLYELYGLWNEFYDGINPDIDPSDDFHNSEYLAKLKNFLSQRESLAVSGSELSLILEQPDFKAIDKKITLSNGDEYTIRVIRYIADYEIPIISHTLVPTKFAFVQCWNDDVFYFNTLSDGDVHSYVYDFYPLEIDGVLHIILTGTTFPFYLRTPFLWAWHLEKDGFKQSDIFDFKTVETDKYFIQNNVDLENSHCLLKWTFQTDGSFICLERRMEYDKEIFSDYLYVACDVIEDGKTFLFTASDYLGEKIEPTIQISLVNDKFVIE